MGLLIGDIAKNVCWICADCDQMIEHKDRLDHLISEIPGPNGVYIAWHAKCYYKNRTEVTSD